MTEFLHFTVEGKSLRAIWPDLPPQSVSPSFRLIDPEGYELISSVKRLLSIYYVLTPEECYTLLVELLQDNKECLQYVENQWKCYRKDSPPSLRLV